MRMMKNIVCSESGKIGWPTCLLMKFGERFDLGYEFEESQTKIDIADMILEDLVFEFAKLTL